MQLWAKIPPLIRVPLRWGLVGSSIGILVIASLFLMGKHPLVMPIIFDFRIILFSVFIFLSLKEYRDYYNQGIIHFWQGMLGSYVFITSFAVIVSGFILVFAKTQSTFIARYVGTLTQQMIENKEAMIQSVGLDAYTTQFEKLPGTSALNLTNDYFLKSFIIGLFLTIIISVIVRRLPKTQ